MCQRPVVSWLGLSAALVWSSIFPQVAASQTFERLPQTNQSIAQLERLPSADGAPTAGSPQRDFGAPVRFAGGSIELQVPDGWWAGEVPFGREFRVVMAPQRPANVRKMPGDGIWMTYHAVAHTEIQGNEALSRELSERMRSAGASNGQLSQPTWFQFGQWPAMVAEFTVNEPSLANVSLTGRHVLVRTDWGVFEFHASAPDSIVESRSNLWTATWESLRLIPPATTTDSVPNGANESKGIVGNWKAYRSQMRFSDDGRVVIIPDAAGGNQSPSPLTGTFDARDDLVFVRWDDGSRLNFRWRMEGSDLYLTDHEGQISHLKRVFN